MQQLVIYIHGQGGSAEEADHYRPLFKNSRVVGMSYRADTPWKAEQEFSALFDTLAKGYSSVVLIANSIGAYFAMNALAEKNVAKAYFISPIVDMEKLIGDMMVWANVSESELKAQGEIRTAFGQTLSWEYLRYVREHPIRWHVPTHILYGEKDTLTALTTISSFAEHIGATVTVMGGGEHWFHTEEQMTFLDGWIKAFEG